MKLKEKVYQILQERVPSFDEKLNWLKSFTLPGFGGVSVYQVITFFITEIKTNTPVIRAQAVTYSFFLAIFPGLIFVCTLIPYIPIDGFQANLLEIISRVLPTDSTFSFVRSNIEDVINKPRFDMLSFGFISCIIFASNGMISMMRSFDKANEIFVHRNFIQTRWVALKLTFIILFLFIAGILFISLGDNLLNWLLVEMNFLNTFSSLLFNGLRYLIIFLLFLLSISILYRYGPAVEKKWPFFNPGSLSAAFGCIAASILFSKYLESFGQYNTVYGSLGSIVVLLIFMYINALILLIAYELSHSIYYNLDHKEKEEQEILAP